MVWVNAAVADDICAPSHPSESAFMSYWDTRTVRSDIGNGLGNRVRTTEHIGLWSYSLHRNQGLECQPFDLGQRH
jgi:hypothetical protein